MTFAGDLVCGQFVNAVEAEDGHDTGRVDWGIAFEGLDHGEGVAGDGFVRELRLRGEPGEEAARGFLGVEGTVWGHGDVRGEVEETGEGLMEGFEGPNVEVIAGGGEEDEGLAEFGSEPGDFVAEAGGIRLDGENGRDGCWGPGADLACVREDKTGGLGIKAEGGAKGAREPRPAQFKEGDVVGCENEVRAG